MPITKRLVSEWNLTNSHGRVLAAVRVKNGRLAITIGLEDLTEGDAKDFISILEAATTELREPVVR